MTVQYIYWSEDELNILRLNYPSVGILGCMKLMPNRSRMSVRYQIQNLHLKRDLSQSDIARFMAGFEKRPSGCWEWISQINKSGYGVFSVRGYPVPAHRYSYSLHNRCDTGTLLVCHKCDNPVCVNPDHLFLGTQLENIRDMVKKGRRRNQYSPDRVAGTTTLVAALFGPATNQ